MAVIKYNGSTIARIYEGQRITLHTEGHELVGDLVVEGFNGDEAPFSTEEVTVTPTKATQTISPSNADFISKAVVKPIPDEYVIPEGSITIADNGSYDVSGKKTVIVNVLNPSVSIGPGGGIMVPVVNWNKITPSTASPSVSPTENWLRRQGGYVIGAYSVSQLVTYYRGEKLTYRDHAGNQCETDAMQIGTVDNYMKPSELKRFYAVLTRSDGSVTELAPSFITPEGKVLVAVKSNGAFAVSFSFGYDIA